VAPVGSGTSGSGGATGATGIVGGGTGVGGASGTGADTVAAGYGFDAIHKHRVARPPGAGIKEPSR